VLFVVCAPFYVIECTNDCILVEIDCIDPRVVVVCAPLFVVCASFCVIECTNDCILVEIDCIDPRVVCRLRTILRD